MTIPSLISYAETVSLERRLARGVTAAEIAAAPEAQRYELAQIRGRANERRALLALRSTPLPIWLVHYRPAGPTEDRRGIDLVVICDDHRSYPVQLKSSHFGAVDFARERQQQAADIAVVVISDGMPLRRLAERILKGVERMRFWK